MIYICPRRVDLHQLASFPGPLSTPCTSVPNARGHVDRNKCSSEDEAFAKQLQEDLQRELDQQEQKDLDFARSLQQEDEAKSLPAANHVLDDATDGDAAYAAELQKQLDLEVQAQMAKQLLEDGNIAKALADKEQATVRQRASEEARGLELAVELGHGTAVRKRARPQQYVADFEPTYKRKKPGKRAMSADTAAAMQSAAQPVTTGLPAACGSRLVPLNSSHAASDCSQVQSPSTSRQTSMPRILQEDLRPQHRTPLRMHSEPPPQQGTGPATDPSSSGLSSLRHSTAAMGSSRTAAPPARRFRAFQAPSDSDVEDLDYQPDVQELAAPLSASDDDTDTNTDTDTDPNVSADEAAKEAAASPLPVAELNYEPDIDLADEAGSVEPPSHAGKPARGRARGPGQDRGRSRSRGVLHRYTRQGLEELRQRPEWRSCLPFELDAAELNQHPPCKAGKPYILYEQVFGPDSFSLDELSKVSRDLQESPVLVMDASEHFSAARRLRLYCTNIRGHRSAHAWVKQQGFHKASLREIIQWPDDVRLPGWVKHPAATINTQQFPGIPWLNACSHAIIAAGPDATELPEVVTHGNRDFRVNEIVKRSCLVPKPEGGCRALTSREVEAIMGFRKNHTRWYGSAENSAARRRQMLGNAFQVDNVAYILSPLKDLQDAGELPTEGITVLSLFDGIGGALAALIKLGVRVGRYITCEKDPACEAVVKRFVCRMVKTGKLPANCQLQQLGDICPPASQGQQPPITEAFVRELVRDHGCHLIIGGSPCNNLSGNNRQPSSSATGRSGFAGGKSKLFGEFVNAVRFVRDEYARGAL